MPSIVTATIAHHTDWPGFRQQARALLLAGVDPAHVLWQVADTAQPDLFANAAPTSVPAHQGHAGLASVARSGTSAHSDSAPIATSLATSAARFNAMVAVPAKHAAPQVPARFVAACQRIILHRDAERLPLMYRLLWRLQREPMLRSDVLDPDVQQASQLQRAVQREIHHLHAFVRFRPVQVAADWHEKPGSAAPRTTHAGPATALQTCGAIWQIAWFEPQHYTVHAAAGFFVRRFPNHCWAILTPHGSVYWDTHTLYHGDAASAADAPAPDADEALWLAYYASTFNPARLKLATMRHFMPRHYWKNLPEAQLIQPLAATAHQRVASMLRADTGHSPL